jgi:hypothetical protein
MMPPPCLRYSNSRGNRLPEIARTGPAGGRSRYAFSVGISGYPGLAADQSNMSSPMKNLCMRCPGIFLFLVVIACVLLAGCTQSAGTGPVTPAVTATTPATADPVTPDPAPAETGAVVTAVATAVPQEVVTIVHYIPLVKDVKDSAHLFSLQVPAEWSVSTYQLENPENFEGVMYQTDLVRNNTFYIHTFSNYRNRDQNYRDECKRWVPAPNATVVTINGITFDRFESTSGGKTNVTYVARNYCANNFGFLTVIAYTADANNPFAVEDYDRVVSSFRYYGHDEISKMPGEEIKMLLPDEVDAGSARSAVAGGSASLGSKKSSAPVCPNKR